MLTTNLLMKLKEKGSEIVIFNEDHIVREIALINEEAVDHYLAEDNFLDDELEEDT